jgi:hypothetical protein
MPCPLKTSHALAVFGREPPRISFSNPGSRIPHPQGGRTRRVLPNHLGRPSLLLTSRLSLHPLCPRYSSSRHSLSHHQRPHLNSRQRANDLVKAGLKPSLSINATLTTQPPSSHHGPFQLMVNTRGHPASFPGHRPRTPGRTQTHRRTHCMFRTLLDADHLTWSPTTMEL